MSFGLQSGKLEYVAGYISALFSSAGAPTCFMRDVECVHDSEGHVTPGDLVIAISNSGEGRHIQKNIVNLAWPKAPKADQTESAKSLRDDHLERLRAVIRALADWGEMAAPRDYALFLFAVSGMGRGLSQPGGARPGVP